MSNSSEGKQTQIEDAGLARQVVVELLYGVAQESAHLGDDLAKLGNDLCRPPELTSPSDRIVWMQSFDRMEQIARAQARFAKWLADCLAVEAAPSAQQIAAALEVFPLHDMKIRLARIAGLPPGDHSPHDPAEEDIWFAAPIAGEEGVGLG